MPCLYPRTVGFLADGNSITFDEERINKEYASFKLPCSKCIECRLDYSYEWALRCVKEAMTHERSCFLTLTYDDDHLGKNRLDYSDFQKFIGDLRDHIMKTTFPDFKRLSNKGKKQFREDFKNEIEKTRISVMATGEYGTESKRKHFHAIIFNYSPTDLVYHKSNPRGDKIYTSKFLSDLWGQGYVTVGDVTFESASYCARYSLKALEHGHDKLHPYAPISKKSNKNAIGKRWIERYWRNVFELGYVEHEGVKHSIPRYFKKWFQRVHPEEWEKWIRTTDAERKSYIYEIEQRKKLEEDKINEKRRARGKSFGVNEAQQKEIISLNRHRSYQRRIIEGI